MRQRGLACLRWYSATPRLPGRATLLSGSAYCNPHRPLLHPAVHVACKLAVQAALEFAASIIPLEMTALARAGGSPALKQLESRLTLNLQAGACTAHMHVGVWAWWRLAQPLHISLAHPGMSCCSDAHCGDALGPKHAVLLPPGKPKLPALRPSCLNPASLTATNPAQMWRCT